MLIGRRGSSGPASSKQAPEQPPPRAAKPAPTRQRTYKQPTRSRWDGTRSAALGALIVAAGIGGYLALGDPGRRSAGTEVVSVEEITTGRPASESRGQATGQAVSAPVEAVPGEEPAAGNVETAGGVRDVSGLGITRLPLAGTELVRLPSAVEVPAPPEPPEPAPDLYRLVVFLDADRIDARGRIIQLAHVEAPEASARCTSPSGAEWPCGMRARTAVRRLVQRRIIECDPVGLLEAEAQPVVTTQCSVAGTDIGKWLVEQGWAQPIDDPPQELVALHRQAKAEQRGLYAPDAR